MWVWRRPAPRVAGLALSGPLCLGALVATTAVSPPPAQSWPCAEDPYWAAGEPLRLQLLESPSINDSFLRGMRLTDADGGEVQLVAALVDGRDVAVCARDGLPANSSFTWEIGPWPAASSSNELEFSHSALPTLTFTTGSEDGEPAADSSACAALVTSAALDDSECDGGWDSGLAPDPA